jgi:predicted permease
MLAELASVVAPVLVMALVGYLWGRSGARFDGETISNVVLWVGAPCLIFHSLTTSEVDAAALSKMAGMALAALLTFAVVGASLLRLLRMPLPTYVGSVVFANTGNLGLPLCLFAFGDDGLSLGVAFFTVSFVVHTSVGPAIVAGERSFAHILRSPMAWSVLVSVIAAATDAHVPLWLARATQILGGLVIPLMLLTLGVSLAKLEARHVPRSALVAALRLGLGVVIGLALAELGGLEGESRGVFVLECATPIGVLNYILAEKYGRAPEEVAGAVLISTLASLVTLPALLSFLLPAA